MTSETRKARKKQQQSEEILAAARDLFIREGYFRFSMRKLAREVGCVPGTLYLYFKDKDTLVSRLIEESFEHLMVDLEAQADPDDLLRTLDRITHAYVEFGLANPEHYRFAFMLERTPSMDEARPVPHRSYGWMRDIVAECMERGLLRAADPDLVAQGIWVAMHGVTSAMITMPKFPWADRQELIDRVLDGTIQDLLPDSDMDPEQDGDTNA
ncbi:MAG: TetR/AcrR family transcriptional regulator [bacterium]|nr:TetR/AcrR family transcriptional regulator [bacterium]